MIKVHEMVVNDEAFQNFHKEHLAKLDDLIARINTAIDEFVGSTGLEFLNVPHVKEMIRGPIRGLNAKIPQMYLRADAIVSGEQETDDPNAAPVKRARKNAKSVVKAKTANKAKAKVLKLVKKKKSKKK